MNVFPNERLNLSELHFNNPATNDDKERIMRFYLFFFTVTGFFLLLLKTDPKCFNVFLRQVSVGIQAARGPDTTFVQVSYYSKQDS